MKWREWVSLRLEAFSDFEIFMTSCLQIRVKNIGENVVCAVLHG